MDKQDLLIEIGTEELPPKALKRLATSFANEIHEGLDKQELVHESYQWFASPRRLAVIVRALATEQEDREVEKRGPAVAAAFDDEGNPTKAAEGFARSCGVEVAQLERLETDKGSWLAYRAHENGEKTSDLLGDIINNALARLPIPKRMRWGDGEAEFVRPVHWVCIVFGEAPTSCNIMGIESNNITYGHRFHSPGAITIASASAYPATLESTGRVMVDYDTRLARVREQVEACAAGIGGNAMLGEDLLEEVCALVEWPVALHGEFDSEFLSLPAEALVASMQDHQKYFPVTDKDGKLLNYFITVSNIESTDPDEIRRGNERVIYPRLADAAFFYKRDSAKALSDYQAQLADIIYQKQLGTLKDKSRRVASLAVTMAEQLGLDKESTNRAALLAKCDLVTSMVGEFPELQGVMGKYYARLSGENEEVALAIDEHYKPRFAGDTLPSQGVGQVLSLAEKIDTLVGIFAIGQAPTGDKDPFGLRRAAIGLLRIMVECELELDTRECLGTAAAQYTDLESAAGCVEDVFEFIMQRMKRYYLDVGIPVGVFDSVHSLAPANLLDFHRRIDAVHKFSRMPEAESLSAANKRIQNILRKSDIAVAEEVNQELLREEAEVELASSIQDISSSVQPLLDSNDHESVLGELARLRGPVDRFFDDVMVMSEDESLKQNRLAILGKIDRLFMSTADISRLQV